MVIKKSVKIPRLPKRSIYLSEYKATQVDPLKKQQKVLQTILQKNKNTVYGKKYNFASIKTYADFAKTVPLITYEDIRRYVQRIADGETNVLTKDDVEFLATTSGTTTKPKLIPVTRERIRLLRKEMVLWMNYAFLKDPSLIRGKLLYLAGSYDEGLTPSGIMKGSISGYVAYKTPLFAKTKLAITPETYKELDVEKKQLLLALQALKVNISQIGFASPVEGIQFFKFLEEKREHLIVELVKTKPLLAKKLALLPNFKAKTIWPSLALVNTLLGPSQLPYIEKLQEYIGDAKIRDPGIYASEGRVTLGITDYDDAGVLVAQETFFEFCLQTAPNEFAKPVLVDALKKNKQYKVIMTTKEGLYRYDMGDVVEVIDFKKKLPILKFVSRSRFMNLVGELASEEALLAVMQSYLDEKNISCEGYTFIPHTKEKEHKPSYELLIEAKLSQADVNALEKSLKERIFDYRFMREEFNRLGPLQVSLVKPGSYSAFEKTRRGQPKPIVLAAEEFKNKFTIVEELHAK